MCVCVSSRTPWGHNRIRESRTFANERNKNLAASTTKRSALFPTSDIIFRLAFRSNTKRRVSTTITADTHSSHSLHAYAPYSRWLGWQTPRAAPTLDYQFAILKHIQNRKQTTVVDDWRHFATAKKCAKKKNESMTNVVKNGLTNSSLFCFESNLSSHRF